MTLLRFSGCQQPPDMELHNLDYFRLWVSERIRIHHRRFVQKKPPPWTDNPVLQKYRFCLPFRELDYGTTILLEHTAQYFSTERVSHIPPGVLLWLLAYRFAGGRDFFSVFPQPFSSSENLLHLVRSGIAYQLEKTQQVVRPIAYSSPPVLRFMHRKKDVYSKTLKWLKHFPPNPTKRSDFLLILIHAVESLGLFTEDEEYRIALSTPQNLQDYLMKVPGVSGFISYEVVTDVSYLLSTWNYPMQFVQLGPGAVPGVHILMGHTDAEHIRVWTKLIADPPSYQQYFCTLFHNQDTLFEPDIPDLLVEMVEKLWPPIAPPPPYSGQWLSPRNVEHTLCEVRKYVSWSRGIGKGVGFRPVVPIQGGEGAKKW